jgi:alkylhydroperoxidase family enzyme
MSEPRIPPVTDPDEAQQEALAGAMPPGSDGRPRAGGTLNIFATLAHNPRLLRRFLPFGGTLLYRGKLPAREREIVILRIGWRARSVYEFGQHTLIGRAAGLSDAEIAALAGAAHDWSDADRCLVALADELHDTDTVGDETWAALAARYDESELVELLLLAGFYRMVSGFLNAAGVQLDEGVPGFPPTP